MIVSSKTLFPQSWADEQEQIATQERSTAISHRNKYQTKREITSTKLNNGYKPVLETTQDVESSTLVP
jgi:hypothetical protein